MRRERLGTCSSKFSKRLCDAVAKFQRSGGFTSEHAAVKKLAYFLDEGESTVRAALAELGYQFVKGGKNDPHVYLKVPDAKKKGHHVA